MLNKKTKYALNALIYMARKAHEGPILISTIAADQKHPQKFLEAILLELKNVGLLTSKRGKGGGYYLAKEPKDIVLGEIIRLFEGPLAPVSCVSQTAYKRCEECSDERCCGIRLVMKEVRDAIAGILDHTSLADILEKIDQNKPTENFSYVI